MRGKLFLWAVIAGMPSFTLSDAARLRVQTISFFAAGILLCAWIVGRLWNGLRGDFPKLPKLTYRKSVTIVVLWGLAFIIVLTMISGARELMSPGAWRKQGFTYRLTDGPQPPGSASGDVGNDESVALRNERKEQLRLLHVALTQYARDHDGHFPDFNSFGQIPNERWQMPGAFGMHYVYLPERQPESNDSPVLAYEPEVFGDSRFLLLKSGRIVESTGDIANWLPQGKTP